MYAQLRGNSQNLVKVVSGGLPRDASEQPPVVEHDTPQSARINGRKSFGMLAMDLAVSTALEKARGRWRRSCGHQQHSQRHRRPRVGL